MFQKTIKCYQLFHSQGVSDSLERRSKFLCPTGRSPATFVVYADMYLAQYESFRRGVMGDRGGKSRFGFPTSSCRPWGGMALPTSMASV